MWTHPSHRHTPRMDTSLEWTHPHVDTPLKWTHPHVDTPSSGHTLKWTHPSSGHTPHVDTPLKWTHPQVDTPLEWTHPSRGHPSSGHTLTWTHRQQTLYYKLAHTRTLPTTHSSSPINVFGFSFRFGIETLLSFTVVSYIIILLLIFSGRDMCLLLDEPPSTPYVLLDVNSFST